MPEYHRRMPTGWSAKGRMTGRDVNIDGPWPRALTDWFRSRAMADLTQHARRATHSPWSRICRWQLGMPTGWRVWLWGIPAILVQHFLAWHIPHRTPSGATTPIMVASSLAMLPTILAVTQSVGWLTLRMRTADCELMLPVSRLAYVRQWSAAMALGHFQLWGAICVSTIAWWLLAAPTTPPWTYLTSVAAVAFLAQIGLFGVMSFAWIITGIRLLQMIAFMTCIFTLTIFVMNGCDDIHAQLRPATLPAAAGAAALGLLLSYLGYRRRLMADFD
jgi:amino acid transporter